jgi:gliding motility-associated-like protein
VSGLNVKWYNAASGGNEIPDGTLLVDGMKYYASQTSGECESIERLEVTVSLVPCNVTSTHTPSVSDFSKSTTQNQSFSFDQSDFTSNYTDIENHPLVKIRIESLASDGTLDLAGLDVTKGQEILLEDLNKLKFTPRKDFAGETSFQWAATDGLKYSASNAIVNITVTAVKTYVPSGFSPNGDGINDYFVIKGADQYVVTLMIFDRWGTKVYESSHYKNDWNGTGNVGSKVSKALPSGTYYYTVNYNNGEAATMGYLTLIK